MTGTRLTQRLMQTQELNVILLLIPKKGKNTPYQVRITENRASLGNKFSSVNPGKQEEVVDGIVRYYERVCLNHPGSEGHLEIYDRRLLCLGSYQLVETGVTDSQGVLTAVKKLDEARHQDLLQNNQTSLEAEIEREILA